MSGIVDMWTSELARLREKGQAIWSSSGSAAASQEASEQKIGRSKWWKPDGFGQALQAKKLPSMQLSDGAISMLLDNLSA